MIKNVRDVLRVGGLAFLLTSCMGPGQRESVEVVPSFSYKSMNYSCTGLKGSAQEYERISIFTRDSGMVFPILHYWKNESQIQVINGTLTQEQAQELVTICQEELKKHAPYKIE